MTRAARWAIVLAIGLRVASVWLSLHANLPWQDPDEYLSRAAALGTQPFVVALNVDGYIRAPLYPYLLHLAMLAGFSTRALLYSQTLLSAFTVAGAFVAARVLGGPRAAVAAAFAVACSPLSVAVAASLWSEHLSVPLATCGLALIVLAIERPSVSVLLSAGAVFGAEALTRSASLYLFPLVLLVAAWRLRWRAAIAAAAFAAVTGGYIWACSAAAGRLMLIENVAELDWAHEARGPDAAPGSPARMMRSAIAVMRERPATYLRDGLGRLHVALSPRPWFWPDARPRSARAELALASVMFVMLIVAAAAAPVGVWRSRDRLPAVVLGVWIAAHLLLIVLMPVTASTRFRAPWEPSLFVLASAGLAALVAQRPLTYPSARRRSRRAGSIGPVAGGSDVVR